MHKMVPISKARVRVVLDCETHVRTRRDVGGPDDPLSSEIHESLIESGLCSVVVRAVWIDVQPIWRDPS